MSRPRHGRSIAFAYTGVALPALVALLLYPHLIHNLGAERFGALSLILSIAVFFGNFDFGVGLAITRYVARFDGRSGARSGIRHLVTYAFWLQTGIGLVTAGLLLLTHQYWGLFRATSGAGLIDEFNRAVLWLSASIPLALMAGLVRCSFEGIGRFGIANALRAPASIGIFAVPIAVSFFTTRLDILTLSILLTRTASTVIFVFTWLQIAPPGVRRPFRAINFWRQSRILLNYGGWVMVGVAAGGLIVLGVVDRVLIARLMDVVAVVQYSVSSDVITRGLLIPSAIASVLLTVLTRTVFANARHVPELHREAIRVMAGQVGPIVVLLVLNAKWLLGMLTRLPVPEAAILILQGMATGYYVQALAHVPYCGLHAAGAPKAAGLRHLFQLPVYALASSAILVSGHIGSMGWLWCLWAVIDLLMLLALLRHIAPRQRGPSAFVQPQVLVWTALIGLSHLSPLLPMESTLRPALSVLAGVMFIWQSARLLISRSIFGS